MIYRRYDLAAIVGVAYRKHRHRQGNRLEHCMFFRIKENWRGRPLTSWGVVINLIGSTATNQDLTIKALLNEHQYHKSIKISDKKFSSICPEKFEVYND